MALAHTKTWVLTLPENVLIRAAVRVQSMPVWWRCHQRAATIVQKLLETHNLRWTGPFSRAFMLHALAIAVELQIGRFPQE